MLDLIGPARTIPSGSIIQEQGLPDPGLFVLHSGWAAGTIELINGSSQIVKIHLPGDLMGTPSLPYERAMESFLALTTVEVSELSLTALGKLFATHPRVGALLFVSAQEEQDFLIERLASVGRTEAPSRMAALLLHLQSRLAAQVGIKSRRLEIPLSQQQLGDVLGLSEIHVNRVLQQMERDGFIRRDKRQFEILRAEALRSLAGIPNRKLRRDHAWLPSPRSDEADARARTVRMKIVR